MEAHLRAVPAPSAEEAELVGHAPSFEEFYEASYRRLFTALCLVTGNRHEAEEVMQDAFLRVFERWDKVAGLEAPEAYLFRTAMNVFRNRYRRATLALRRTLSLAPATDDLAAVEARDEVIRLLRGLPPRERAAVLLTSIMDLSNEEAGRMLGVKASTVRALTSRARAQMKDKVVELP
jgi:RNA polymerase sigma-70 factor (ECF subfamily)